MFVRSSDATVIKYSTAHCIMLMEYVDTTICVTFFLVSSKIEFHFFFYLYIYIFFYFNSIVSHRLG